MKRALLAATTALVMLSSNTSCRHEQATENPFFIAWDTPYGIPPFDQIRPEHYVPAFERAMSLQNAEIDAIASDKSTPTFANTIEAYDRTGSELERVGSVFGMLSESDSNTEMQAIQQELMPRLSAHEDAILMNGKLFDRIAAVYEGREGMGLTPTQLRLTEKTYERFVRAGAKLDNAGKAELQKINSELALLSVQFSNNLLAENDAFRLILGKDDLKGLPQGVIEAAREAAAQAELGDDQYLFTLSKPSMLPFLTYSQRRDLREQLYKGYISRGNNGNENDNKALIVRMAQLRQQKAALLGYESYAAYVTADEMARTPEAAFRLLDDMWAPALNRAKEELAAMETLFKKDFPDGEFASWDWWYYAEKVRKADYNFDEEMIRPYLALENVMDGIFFLANRLYGITFRPVSVPLYHPETTAYEVLDEDGSHLGILYFDLHPRKSKSGGAWCGYFREQRYADGERVAPVVGIVANFTRPTASAPALLTVDETETLFHEFGHALHFLFHDVRYRGLSEVEGDFVELPSQIMENWAFHPELLTRYATHYRDHREMPQTIIDRLNRSRLFNQGFMTTELAAAALSDLEIHSLTASSPELKNLDVNAFERRVLNEKRGLIPQIEPRYHYPYFAHIFAGGYSSGYYFYLWAEVLDQDAFAYFAEGDDICDRKKAAAFRNEILKRGGEVDGMTMYRAFRGQDPDAVHMLRSRGLVDDPAPEEEQAETEASAKPAAQVQNLPARLEHAEDMEEID